MDIKDRALTFKDMDFKIQDMDGKGKFQGLGATNGNLDKGLDRFHPGQWKKSIKDHGDDPFALYVGHDTRVPVGSFYGKDVPEGLFMDGRLNLSLVDGTSVPAVPKAHEVRALYVKQDDGRPDMKGLSVGYIPVKITYDTEKIGGKDITVRNIFESVLIEVSFTGNPMNEMAMVTDMKGEFNFIDYIACNLKDKDIRYKWISLRYPGMEPEWVETTLDKAFKALQEPGTSTPPVVEEPKGFYTVLAENLNRR